jgi:hypothetical protein
VVNTANRGLLIPRAPTAESGDMEINMTAAEFPDRR